VRHISKLHEPRRWSRREPVTADCAKEPEIKPLTKSVAPIELVKKLENDTRA
jgi:hypothetical protein